MTFNFDEDADVLYVTFANPKKGVRYVTTDRGDVLRFCTDSEQIVGVTILFFTERCAKGEEINIPEVGIVAFSSAMSVLVGSGGRSEKVTTTH